MNVGLGPECRTNGDQGRGEAYERGVLRAVRPPPRESNSQGNGGRGESRNCACHRDGPLFRARPEVRNDCSGECPEGSHLGACQCGLRGRPVHHLKAGEEADCRPGQCGKRSEHADNIWWQRRGVDAPGPLADADDPDCVGRSTTVRSWMTLRQSSPRHASHDAAPVGPSAKKRRLAVSLYIAVAARSSPASRSGRSHRPRKRL